MALKIFARVRKFARKGIEFPSYLIPLPFPSRRERSLAIASRSRVTHGGFRSQVSPLRKTATPENGTRARALLRRPIFRLSIRAPREGGLRGIRNTLTAPDGMHYRCSRLRLEGRGGRGWFGGDAAPGKNSPLVKAIAFTFHATVF